MTTQQQDMIISDFEKYIHYLKAHNQAFTLVDFVSFASSLVNFYNGSQLINSNERKDTALLLCQSFNKGMGNRITTSDLDEISDLIISDVTLDYSVINPIFG